ncbi:MAG TPA: extracellular solute-binding protein [Rectinemataceae bacterium]|nr:extracellular solute-binding protein [Rectinemataceae bacterium]
MATIKDIAKIAGVSQGTASNVLNGKGIVSSEKIRLVEAAAASLGYTINERAKLLRQGNSKIFAVILPNTWFKHYVDFFRSFTSFSRTKGFSTLLYLSNDDPETERRIIAKARSSMARGIVAFSCSKTMRADYREAGFEDSQVLFVERDQDADCNYIGFDYARCGKSMAELAIASNLKSVALVTDNLEFSNERDFRSAFLETLSAVNKLRISQIQTDMFRKNQNAMQMFDAECPQGVFVSNFGFSETIRDVLKTFYRPADTQIYTISPIFTMPESNFIKYELNYRLMGKRAAECLISHLGHRTTGQKVILENSGFRDWAAPKLPQGGSKPTSADNSQQSVNVLTLDSPEASAIRYLALLYTQSTGVQVNVSVSSYDEIHEILSSMDESSIYDIIRLDVTWLSWFAGRILLPLEEISPTIPSMLATFVDGISRQYSFVKDKLYALPLSPSAQVLFYRKDLFESTVLKRLYQETYRTALAPPTTFEEYNRVARFFTKSFNPQSPVDFGTTMTLGSTGVAGTEFLSRYFSRSRNLFDDSGRILLDSEEARLSLDELIEAKRYSKDRYCSWWTNAAQEFSDGNVAMTILYSNFASEILNRNSKVVNRIGYALVPGGSPIIGGGSLGVSRYSRNPELALSFIKWMCSEPISSAAMLLGGVSSCKKAYENYEIIDTYPWLELAKDCFAYSKNKRTPYADFAPFDERRFLSILGLEVKNAYIGALSSADALEKAQKAYERQFKPQS